MQRQNELKGNQNMIEKFKKNSGVFIKKFAEIWFEITVSLGIICLLLSLLAYFTNSDCLAYSSFLGGYSNYESLIKSGNTAYFGLLGIKLSIAAMLSGILFAVPLYGFGIVVENAERSLAALTQAVPSNPDAGVCVADNADNSEK